MGGEGCLGGCISMGGSARTAAARAAPVASRARLAAASPAPPAPPPAPSSRASAQIDMLLETYTDCSTNGPVKSDAINKK